MAPASTAVRGMASLVSLLLAVSMVSAQSVQPSNATLPTSESGSEFVLSFTGGPIPPPGTYNIAPLTTDIGKGGDMTTLASFIFPQGAFKQVDYSSVGNVGQGDIAFISCDPNGSNIDASTLVGNVGDIIPKVLAILLYSLTAQECNLNGSYSYTSIFSMTSLKDSSSLIQYLANFPPAATDVLKANIGLNATSANSSASSSSTANAGSPAPTTAVAMSILYSITGIITLLFLVIIATGAVRAHRHPERYGPRTEISGRPRQSRAKGLARAMLETLPIVKFGDPETAVKPNHDIELGETHMATDAATDSAPEVMTTSGGNGEEDAKDAKSPAAEAMVLESGIGPAEGESVHSHDHAHDDHEGHDHEDHEGHDHDGHDHGKKETTVPEEDGHLGCSICTDDFCTGEDVRVLPCNHKFHPACVDPWLLNVSGTCPLCRHDLRPKAEEEPSEDTEGGEASAAGELPPPLAMPEEPAPAYEEEDGNQPRSRASRLLDIHRLRHAPADERIAALRELREQTQNEPETAEADADAEAEGTSRRVRLTGRLRDAFKIKTRTQDTPPAQ